MINKKNIKRCIASVMLGATILAGIGVTVKEKKTDHTEKLCLITEMLNKINPKDSSPLGVVLHQMPEMTKDYKEKGIENVSISYKSYEEERIETIYAKPVGKRIGNSTIQYIAPDDFELCREENGKVVCKKEVTVTEMHHYLEADVPYAKRLKLD